MILISLFEAHLITSNTLTTFDCREFRSSVPSLVRRRDNKTNNQSWRSTLLTTMKSHNASKNKLYTCRRKKKKNRQPKSTNLSKSGSELCFFGWLLLVMGLKFATLETDGNWSRNAPRNCSWDCYWYVPVSYWPFFPCPYGQPQKSLRKLIRFGLTFFSFLKCRTVG